jgi:predicted transcriptional regulator
LSASLRRGLDRESSKLLLIFYGCRILGRNRDRLSIVAAVLEAANTNGASKTRIMYQANLSYSLLEKYLELVSNAGLLQSVNGKYLATELGKTFLKEYTRFNERYSHAQRTLDSLSSEKERLDKLCAGLA